MPKFEVWMPDETRDLSAEYEGTDVEDVAKQYLRDSAMTFSEGSTGRVNVASESDGDVKSVTFSVERVLDIVTTLEGDEDVGDDDAT